MSFISWLIFQSAKPVPFSWLLMKQLPSHLVFSATQIYAYQCDYVSTAGFVLVNTEIQRKKKLTILRHYLRQVRKAHVQEFLQLPGLTLF